MDANANIITIVASINLAVTTGVLFKLVTLVRYFSQMELKINLMWAKYEREHGIQSLRQAEENSES